MRNGKSKSIIQDMVGTIQNALLMDINTFSGYSGDVGMGLGNLREIEKLHNLEGDFGSLQKAWAV